MMTPDEFMTVALELFPEAVITEDEDGQLVIHTGLHERETDEGMAVVPISEQP